MTRQVGGERQANKESGVGKRGGGGARGEEEEGEEKEKK